MKILSLALRPRKLSSLYGQASVVKAVREHMASRPPQAWLFIGQTGVGKTTIARIMSVAYQCGHMALWGDPCEECWKRRGEFAIHEINASEVSGIEELGRVVELSKYRPTQGDGKRVIILDEFQRVSTAAQHMMLKPFEEPPPATVWILCTTEPGKILPTLRRRCTTYQLRTLRPTEAEKFLRAKALTAKIERELGPLLEEVNTIGISAPAPLLMALEKYAAGSTPAEAVTGADAASADSLRICRSVTSGDWAAAKKNLADATPEDARWIRASVAGWLKGCLLRAQGKDADRAAQSLLEISVMVPLDDAAILTWLWAVLYKICVRFGGGK